ncbi:MAG: adenosylcobalamin-dependent ribonucleoside-diphosphate reductase, partial [Trueperaceae bacterium]
RMPEVLNEQLAFFLGYLWGDGFVSSGRVGFAVAHDSPMMELTPRLFKELFDLDVVMEQKENDASVVFVTKAAQLIAWLEANGLVKAKARQLNIPKAVRMAPRPVVGSFLKGLFEADGSLTNGMPTLSTASTDLAEDVATMLAGLGIPTKRRTTQGLSNRYSRHSIHTVRVVSHKGLERFLERVSCIVGSRLAAAGQHVPDEGREKSWILPHATAILEGAYAAMPAGAKGRPSEFTATRKNVSRYIRGERNLTATAYDRLRRDPNLEYELGEFGYDEYYVPVLGVAEAGRSLTLDLSVDENKTYLAGGFVSHNTRRGAGMATLSITHPDVKDFVTAKDLEREQTEGDISTFNISVLVTDEFMERAKNERQGQLYEIAQHAWATGEPGLIYIDRINEHNPMRAELGDIMSTNPCGEIPLYPGEPCDLGALNLAAYVTQRGRGLAGYDFESFAKDVTTSVRFLDNVLDVNKFALEDNRDMSMKLRRLGLGVMGLADALILMGYGYDSEEGRDAVEAMIGALRNAAEEASRDLAAERGSFPMFAQSDLETPRRNVAVLTVAPTGTTSMLMGVSSGVEPVFAPFIYRKIGTDYHALIHPLFQELLEEHQPHAEFYKDGGWDWEKVVAEVQANHGSVQGLAFIPQDVQSVLRCAHDIAPADHVKMQGAVQRAFDGGEKLANSISKTINLPNQATVDDVFESYSLAFSTGCKGITVYRDGSRDFQVLSTSSKKSDKKADTSAAPVAAEGVSASTPAAVAPPPAAEQPRQSGMIAVATTAQAATAQSNGRNEYLPGEPLFERPIRLSGFTDSVKLMLPTGEKRGFFVTVNKQDDLPTEVFIVSGKAGDEANADSEALGRVVSIALQYGVPAEALIKTLRGINGGMYGTYHGRLVASKADLLAVALETAGAENVLNKGRGCPDCGAPLRFEEGCQKCESCGYSKCG